MHPGTQERVGGVMAVNQFFRDEREEGAPRGRMQTPGAFDGYSALGVANKIEIRKKKGCPAFQKGKGFERGDRFCQ